LGQPTTAAKIQRFAQAITATVRHLRWIFFIKNSKKNKASSMTTEQQTKNNKKQNSG
jgi:hypothetical protein